MRIPAPLLPLPRSRRMSPKIQGWGLTFPLTNLGEGFASPFIVDSGSQKNLISAEVVKRLVLPTTQFPQPHNIGWLHEGQDLRVHQQCRLPYSIKPFTDKVLCDVTPLDVCDVLLGQSYLWKRHAVYESRPRAVIISLSHSLYRIP